MKVYETVNCGKKKTTLMAHCCTLSQMKKCETLEWMVLLFGELMSEPRPTAKTLPDALIVVWTPIFRVLTHSLHLTP